MSNTTLRNNMESRRYELVEQGQVVAFAEYERDGDTVKFTHTEVVPGNEGKGFGSLLAKQALDDVRTQSVQIVPVCEFIAGYVKKHPEYAPLVKPGS